MPLPWGLELLARLALLPRPVSHLLPSLSDSSPGVTPCTCRPLFLCLPCRLTRPVGSDHQSQPAGPYSCPTVASGRPLRARSTVRSAAATSSGLSTQAGPSPPSACCQSTPVSLTHPLSLLQSCRSRVPFSGDIALASLGCCGRDPSVSSWKAVVLLLSSACSTARFWIRLRSSLRSLEFL